MKVLPRTRVSISAEDLARAARLLVVRSRREATGLFAGNYASAFRGGGLEFEESRPYAPGDDIAHLDWNAMARSGELFVKRFREERNRTLLFALDTSASMRFGTTGNSKAATAAHALALLATAAGRAGDHTGLVAFDEQLRGLVPPGRGVLHSLRVIRRAVEWAGAARGATKLAAGLRALRGHGRRRAVVILLSDFRDPELLPGTGWGSPSPQPQIGPKPPAAERSPAAPPSPSGELAELARRHDVIALALLDPAEENLPRVGPLRIADPERPGELQVIATGSERARRRYRAAARAWQQRLEQELRRGGADLLWLRTDRSPLHALSRFFRERAVRRVAA